MYRHIGLSSPFQHLRPSSRTYIHTFPYDSPTLSAPIPYITCLGSFCIYSFGSPQITYFCIISSQRLAAPFTWTPSHTESGILSESIEHIILEPTARVPSRALPASNNLETPVVVVAVRVARRPVVPSSISVPRSPVSALASVVAVAALVSDCQFPWAGVYYRLSRQ